MERKGLNGERETLYCRRVLIVGAGFSGLCCARELASRFLVTVVDAKEFFEYTPGILRAYVKPKHLDAITFALQPVIEVRMKPKCKFLWGEVLSIYGSERTASIQLMCQEEFDVIDFDFCIIAAGCNFGPYSRWGESLWFPTIHAKAQIGGSWPQFDERFLEGRRRHILDEFATLRCLDEKRAPILVVGAGFIGVEWVTELSFFFPNLVLTIIDHLPNCLGPLPLSAVEYCNHYMDKCGISQFYGVKYSPDSREFWESVRLPGGVAKEYVCSGVKSSNYFMPLETLSQGGPGGGGWILMDLTLAVKTRDGKPWAVDHLGVPRVFTVGDCTYPCIEQVGKQPDEWPIPPIPKLAYPGEEEAVIASKNVCKADKMSFEGQTLDIRRRPLELHAMHWPWGAGMFATSLGPEDGCFVAGNYWAKRSGCMPMWGVFSALQKTIIESSKVDECAYGKVGRLIWYLVHHTPVHLFGGGPAWGYHS